MFSNTPASRLPDDKYRENIPKSASAQMIIKERLSSYGKNGMLLSDFHIITAIGTRRGFFEPECAEPLDPTWTHDFQPKKGKRKTGNRVSMRFPEGNKKER